MNEETLKDYLESLNASLKVNHQNKAPGLHYESDTFAEFVIDKLAQEENFQTSFGEDREFFQLGNFEWTKNNNKVRIDGCLIVPNETNNYSLNLFIVDYKRRTEVESLSRKEVQDLFSQAYLFYFYAVKPEFQAIVKDNVIASKVCAAITKYRLRINSVPIWILSNRAADDGLDGRISDSVWGQEVDLQKKVVDLKYLIAAEEEKTHNFIDFSQVKGIPALKVSSAERDGYDCFLASIPASYLLGAYSLYGTNLIEKNVRAYLGKNKTNKGIEETIRECPNNFLAFNNGLVIVCSEVVADGNKILKIRDLQIVNGGQTTATLFYTFKAAQRKKDQVEGSRIQENFKNILVPLKVIAANEEKQSQFASNISIAANSQSAIKASDLAASVMYYQEFERNSKQLLTSTGDYWFFERARGAYKAEEEKFRGNRTEMNNFKKRFPEFKKFGKTELAISSLAWEGLPQEASQGAQGAFRVYNEKVKDQIPDKEEVKTRIMKWMVFDHLEASLKEVGLKNPRTSVIYTIALFSSKYGERVLWEKLWEAQSVPENLLAPLIDLAQKVDKTIRDNMGDRMIHMYGRTKDCFDTVRSAALISEMSRFEDSTIIR